MQGRRWKDYRSLPIHCEPLLKSQRLVGVQRIAVGLPSPRLKKAIREHSNALLTLPTSDATGDDTPARELWRDITILDVAVRDLEKDGAAEKLARKTWALAKKIGQEIDVDA